VRAAKQYKAHLNQHLQLAQNRIRVAVSEAFGAIAALQNERISGGGICQLMSKLVDFPGRDQWRKLAKTAQSRFNLLWIIVDWLLLCRS
jgi:hypothetical protein